MRETILRLNSSYLENERSIWICEPESVSGASDLVVFLDAEHYRDGVGALSVIEELRCQVADSGYVFVSQQSRETRWRECPCYPPVSLELCLKSSTYANLVCSKFKICSLVSLKAQKRLTNGHCR
jgi:hypothetical protein